MKSVDYQQAEHLALTHLKELAKQDKEWGLHKFFDGGVLILHEEGTTIFYNHAFVFEVVTELPGGNITWRVVVPEHHPPHLIPSDEATVIQFNESTTYPIRENTTN